MAKFTGKDMVATFGAISFSCLNSLEVSMTADVYTISCACATYKSKVVGNTDAGFSLNYTFDNAAATELSGILPGTTGTFTASTNGTYAPTFSAATVVESHSISTPVEGMVSGTIGLAVDGALTIGGS